MFIKTNRIIIVIICLLMILSSFAACSAKQEEAVSKTTEIAYSANEVSAPVKLLDRELKLKVLMSEHVNQPIKLDSPSFQEMYNKTNVKLEIEAVPSANYNDKKQIALATNNIPDIIFVNQNDIVLYGPQGIFLSLFEPLQKVGPNFMKEYNQNSELKKLTIDEKLYGFPTLSKNYDMMGMGPVIRLDIFKSNNINIPATWDEMYEALKKLKSIYPDSSPWAGRRGTGTFAAAEYSLGPERGLYYDRDIDGGKYVYGATLPAYKETLEFFIKCYKEKIIDPDYATSNSQTWNEKINNNKCFFWYDNSSFATLQTSVLITSNPEAEMKLIPILKNSKGQARERFYPKHWYSQSYAISANTKEPENIVKFIDWLYGDEGSDISNFGVLDKHYTKTSDGEYKIADDLIQKYKDQDNASYKWMSDIGIGLLAFTPLVNGKAYYGFQKQTDIYDEDYWNTIRNDKAYHDPYIDPPLNQKDVERLKDIKTKVDTMFTQEFDRFIMGQKPISEWDSVVKKAMNMGVAEIEKIYNDALSNLK